MSRKRAIMWLAIAIAFAGLVTACGQSSVEIGMVETKLPGRWEARYTTFTGTKVDRIQAESGDAIFLEYEAQVNKGSLRIEIGPSGGETLWDVTLRDDADERVEVVLARDGAHVITIEGDDTGGSFWLAWELQ